MLLVLQHHQDLILGIQTAAYDNITGIITVTTDKVHGFALERPNTVKLKGLEFVCPKKIY